MLESAKRALAAHRGKDYRAWARQTISRLTSSTPHKVPADTGLVVAEPWMVDAVEVRDGQVLARGWALPGVSARGVEQRVFHLNGRPFDEIRQSLPRPDVAAVFPTRPQAQLCGFECRSSVAGEVLYRDGVMEIERVRPQAAPAERGRDCWFIPDAALHGDLPDEDRRYRVIGNRDAEGFLASGATDYHRLDQLTAAYGGRRLHEFERVLDWGSGCGRVARHFPASRASALTGCDIDHDNVDWCRGHLRGTFARSHLEPPLPFPSEQFDLIYGVSVFTHLRESLQLKWLAELVRVATSDALLVMSVHGRTALEFARLSADDFWQMLARIERSGILVSSSNSQLDGHADHRGEYVNVFHSASYIRRVWGRYFDVVAIVPGYVFTHDVVVLRKR